MFLQFARLTFLNWLYHCASCALASWPPAGSWSLGMVACWSHCIRKCYSGGTACGRTGSCRGMRDLCNRLSSCRRQSQLFWPGSFGWAVAGWRKWRRACQTAGTVRCTTSLLWRLHCSRRAVWCLWLFCGCWSRLIGACAVEPLRTNINRASLEKRKKINAQKES